MAHVHLLLFPAMWLIWCAYWWVASRNVKTTARRESIRSRLLHIVPLALAVILLWSPALPVSPRAVRVLPSAEWPFWVGAVLTLAGLLFTVRARVFLGRNWSGIVTVKEGHELITSGPYGLVRHPIYAGLLLAFIGSALARAEWRGILAVCLAFFSFWRKLRMEERWMREQFGTAYDQYALRVAVLIPYLL
jgi:protein-S-isoprenylcysteine O-methyltransferase Ste14